MLLINNKTEFKKTFKTLFIIIGRALFIMLALSLWGYGFDKLELWNVIKTIALGVVFSVIISFFISYYIDIVEEKKEPKE